MTDRLFAKHEVDRRHSTMIPFIVVMEVGQ
jgi:hypothetical protein